MRRPQWPEGEKLENQSIHIYMERLEAYCDYLEGKIIDIGELAKRINEQQS